MLFNLKINKKSNITCTCPPWTKKAIVSGNTIYGLPTYRRNPINPINPAPRSRTPGGIGVPIPSIFGSSIRYRLTDAGCGLRNANAWLEESDKKIKTIAHKVKWFFSSPDSTNLFKNEKEILICSKIVQIWRRTFQLNRNTQCKLSAVIIKKVAPGLRSCRKDGVWSILRGNHH